MSAYIDAYVRRAVQDIYLGLVRHETLEEAEHALKQIFREEELDLEVDPEWLDNMLAEECDISPYEMRTIGVATASLVSCPCLLSLFDLELVHHHGSTSLMCVRLAVLAGRWRQREWAVRTAFGARRFYKRERFRGEVS